MTQELIERLRRSHGAGDLQLEAADALQSQSACIADLKGAVEKAATIFEDYDRMHREKGTLEGDAKAYRNARYAEELRAALAKAES